MRQVIYATSALCALIMVLTIGMLVSCEHLELPNQKVAGDANGNLRVNVFQIEQTPFGNVTRVAVSEACTRLNFLVYDESGSRIKTVNQVSSDNAFGNASFQLEEGNYQLVVIGHSANGNPTSTNPRKIQFTNATGFTDTFLYSEGITIGEEQLNLQISLKRIVALCRFVINDDYPSDVAKIKFYYTGGSGAFDVYTGFGSVASKQDVTIDVKSGQKQFDLYTFLHEQSSDISLKVTALDATGNELSQRTFDVPMEQNHITWYSGNFFNGTGSSSSTTVSGVTVNIDWAGEIFKIF